MSPTVRDDTERCDRDGVGHAAAPRKIELYVLSLLAAALGLVVALAIAGQALPAPGLLLVLAIPLAMCMNRYLFFPNEVGITADAAVLFAAMVAFRGDAQWLGPLVLALLAGPLDARHWGSRSWMRMAFNSGNTTLVTAAGLAVFVPLTHTLGAGWEATLGAAVVVAVPYALSEIAFGVVLLSLLGENFGTAARDQARLHVLVLPLAVLGAGAGLAALAVGWWLALLLLLPVPYVPELAHVVLPRHHIHWARRSCGFVAVLSLAACAFTAEPWTTVMACVGVAILAGVEGRPLRGVPIPLLAVVAVVPAAAGRPAGAAVVGALVVSAASRWYGGDHRVGWAAVVWCVPLTAAAWFASDLWMQIGAPGVWVYVAAMLGCLGLAAAWGAPPWGSRYIGRWSYEHLESHRRVMLVLVAVVALGGSALAAHFEWAPLAASAAMCTQLVVFAALVAVRQWRFDPGPRVRSATVLVLASLASAAVCALVQSPAAVLVVAVATGLSVWVAWPPAL